MDAASDPPMGLTENSAPMYFSSGNPCQDFFIHVVSGTPYDKLTQRIELRKLWLNSSAFVDFGYLKDLTEILYRILEGPGRREGLRKIKRGRKRGRKFDDSEEEDQQEEVVEKKDEEMCSVISKEEARVLRKEREIAKARKALEKYSSDSSDTKKLNSEDLSQISLAAKCCPSIDSSYDKTTLICEGIARRRVRDRLRKQVPYHDKEIFKDILQKVKSGKANIPRRGGGVAPHQIIKSLDAKNENGAEVAELQWSRMVEDMSKKGKLTNCLAVTDVSASMGGFPMELSIALGLLVSELSEEPCKGKLITFSENPEIHLIQGDEINPETVFWNLRYSPSTPVVAKQTGVAMLNGFSKNLLSVFLNEGGNRPVLLMSTKELVIYDRLICDELLIFQ
ncbi:hypothetical protein CICLE_v10006998mg [Citrus x clementina]|uniref:Uncharacterized protein n=1 Tax=Citrus clementina TaxID=85681 RepID=V4U2I5_CITCL|nr:hypothetical protein CICLE_v10006998mg [Citrus x clementina]